MSYPVKFFYSTMENAPLLNNVWGSLVALLDACLVDGFNPKTIDAITRVGAEATATILSGHAYIPGQIVNVAGVTQTEYNGDQRVKTATTNTFTFDVIGLPTTPATTSGTITCKSAALGFQKAFAATNVGVYRSQNVLGPRHYLKVDNSQWAGWTTGAKTSRINVGENMSDVNTFVGARAPFDPNNPTRNDGSGFFKWNTSHQAGSESSGDGGAGPRNWVLIGDDRGFYFYTTASQNFDWYGRMGYTFMEFTSFKAGDAYNTIVSGMEAVAGDYMSYPDQYGPNDNYGSSYLGKYLLRDYSQVGGNIRGTYISLQTNGTSEVKSGLATGINWPNGPDFSLVLHPTYLKQENNHLRGLMPGMFCVHNNNPYNDLAVIDNVVGYPGRKFLMVGINDNTTQAGIKIAFDITGPWR
jgi:hypothetical protein